MSFRLPSQQKQYDAYCSLDPAFVQAPTPPADNVPEEEREAFKVAAQEYLSKFKAAKDTGDWSALLIPGQSPTKFVLGQVDRNVFRAIADRATLPLDNPRHIGPVALYALLFRLALKSIVGLGDLKVERMPDPQWENWTMAQPSVVTTLDDINPGIVGELGMDILNRLQEVQGVRPL